MCVPCTLQAERAGYDETETTHGFFIGARLNAAGKSSLPGCFPVSFPVVFWFRSAHAGRPSGIVGEIYNVSPQQGALHEQTKRLSIEVGLPPGRICATWMLTHTLPHVRPLDSVGSGLKLRIPFQVEAGPCTMQVKLS